MSFPNFVVVLSSNTLAPHARKLTHIDYYFVCLKMAKCMALAKMVDSPKAKKELQRKDEADTGNNGKKNEVGLCR